MTTDSDEYFGPMPDPPALPDRLPPRELLAAAVAGGSRWHCEDELRLTLDAFFECWPDHMPRSSEVRAIHYHAARVLVKEVGEMEAPAFVRWARTVLVTEAPSIPVKSGLSLLWLVPRWRSREGSGPEWMRVPCKECGTIHPPGPCYDDTPEPSDAEIEERMRDKAFYKRTRWPDPDQADPPDNDR